jgi:hypothetical protein
MTSSVLVDHFRCPETLADCGVKGTLLDEPGYFRFGGEAVCFGRTSADVRADRVVASNGLPDALPSASIENAKLMLPFDPAEVLSNLRLERYLDPSGRQAQNSSPHGLIRKAYYALRPIMPKAARRFLQRTYLSGWENITFPSQPVDLSVEQILEKLLRLSMKAAAVERIPFIWFWPEGFSSAVLITHDVEYPAGLDFVPGLMDLDEVFGFKASFQIVPEERYLTPPQLLRQICGRGFEVVVHDLNHDGELFSERNEFLRRAAKINEYAAQFGATGFRSGALYRNLDWFDAFEFSYDMSVPNVGHVEAQRGGCCTAMPYWIGKILEIPLTTTQDYALFHYRREYSVQLWKQQTEMILARHGLISFLVHPDYILERKARQVYESLLKYLGDLRSTGTIWAALPGQVDRWWRARKQMRLAEKEGHWTVEGPECQRARVAFATLRDGKLHYEIERDPATV